MITSHSVALRTRTLSDNRCKANQNTFHRPSIFSPNIVSFMRLREKIWYSWTGHRWQYGACALHAVYETVWENMVQLDRPQITIWRMRIACRLWDWVGKYGTVGQATDNNMAHAHYMRFMRLCGKIWYSRTGHRWQYGACVLHAVYETVWENMVQSDRPQMTIWSMRIACRLWDCGKIWYSRTGHIWQYGACALHSGYLRLQTHT
jgi:hypothetical protein